MMPVRVVSLFSGGGFADYALHRAAEQTGIPVEVVLAVDSWPKAVEVYNANLPSRAVVADVKTLTRTDLPAHDLVIGGPPCQSHSTAGPKDCRCNVGGPASPRCCLADFVRLSAGSAYLMENVRSRLINAPWSEQLCALDFGDVTTRKRWFYSDHLLHVIRTPGPRRLRDIRDYEADRIVSERSAVARLEVRGSEPSTAAGRVSWGGAVAVGMRSSGNAADGRLATVAPDDGALGSVTSHSAHQPLRVGKTRSGPLADGSRVVVESEALGSVTAEAWHQPTPAGVRCPSLLEMARAHSIPDDWDWAGATKTQRGLLIANGWPTGLGTAVLAAMLRAVAALLPFSEIAS